MLTIKEVAKALNLNNMTVYRHLQTGEIKGIKIGSVWRISKEELKRIKREGL